MNTATNNQMIIMAAIDRINKKNSGISRVFFYMKSFDENLKIN